MSKKQELFSAGQRIQVTLTPETAEVLNKVFPEVCAAGVDVDMARKLFGDSMSLQMVIHTMYRWRLG